MEGLFWAVSVFRVGSEREREGEREGGRKHSRLFFFFCFFFVCRSSAAGSGVKRIKGSVSRGESRVVKEGKAKQPGQQ